MEPRSIEIINEANEMAQTADLVTGQVKTLYRVLEALAVDTKSHVEDELISIFDLDETAQSLMSVLSALDSTQRFLNDAEHLRANILSSVASIRGRLEDAV